MSEEELTAGAYPTEWTVAQVLSHLGSGAVITQRRLEDALAGQDTPDDFAPGVWDTWNAKGPVAQRDDALAADAALLARIEAVPPDERNTFASAMGPMTLGFAQFVGMRLNEHAFHTWDIEVVADPAATIPAPVAALVDNLQRVARFTGKPTGDTTTITVATTDPERGFTVELTPGGVALTPGAAAASPDVELPAEASPGSSTADWTPSTLRAASTGRRWTSSGGCSPARRSRGDSRATLTVVLPSSVRRQIGLTRRSDGDRGCSPDALLVSIAVRMPKRARTLGQPALTCDLTEG
jgi:hypothetical protein